MKNKRIPLSLFPEIYAGGRPDETTLPSGEVWSYKKTYNTVKLDVNYYKCECGAEVVHGPDTSHSVWCPKYRKILF